MASPATPENLATLDRALAALAAAQAARPTTTVRLTVAYAGDARIETAAGPLSAGITLLTGPLDLHLPGLARLTIDPGLPAVPALAKAQDAVTVALQAFGAATPQAAQVLAFCPCRI